MVEIKEVQTKKDLKKLLDLPWKLYRNDPKWVAPLRMALKDIFNPKHPFYETSRTKSWLALDKGVEVGRVMAVVNDHHNKFHSEKTGFFGFFEAINDDFIAHTLFETAEKWLIEQGMNKVMGPVNPSTNYEVGTLVEGFEDPPQIMMTYNPAYHKELIEKNGYTKAKDLIAYKVMVPFDMPEKVIRVSDRILEKSKVKFRTVKKSDWDNEVNSMHEIYNDAWEKNWGFIPMTDNEFFHTAKDLKSVIDERLILMAEVEGEVVGFAVCLPDINQVLAHNPSGKLFPTGIFKLLNMKKYVKRCRVITLGLKPKYRKMGLAAVMYRQLQDNIVACGYNEVEMSWVLEDNLEMCKPLELMGGKIYKRYRVFEKNL